MAGAARADGQVIMAAGGPMDPVVRLTGVSLSYGATRALDDISLALPAGCMIGVIGPDGVGKSSLLSLISGARAIQRGVVEALGGDMADRGHREAVCPDIAFMPQGLGRISIHPVGLREH